MEPELDPSECAEMTTPDLRLRAAYHASICHGLFIASCYQVDEARALQIADIAIAHGRDLTRCMNELCARDAHPDRAGVVQ